MLRHGKEGRGSKAKGWHLSDGEMIPGSSHQCGSWTAVASSGQSPFIKSGLCYDGGNGWSMAHSRCLRISPSVGSMRESSFRGQVYLFVVLSGGGSSDNELTYQELFKRQCYWWVSLLWGMASQISLWLMCLQIGDLSTMHLCLQSILPTRM